MTRLRRTTSVLASLVLGGILLAAGLLKAGDPGILADRTLRLLALPPDSILGPVAAKITILLEILLGGALVLRMWPRPAFGASLALTLVFALVIARAAALGERECGCFGEGLKRSPAEALVEDAALLAVALIGFVITRKNPRQESGPRLIPRLLALVAVLALGLAMPLVAPLGEGRDLLRAGRWVGSLPGRVPGLELDLEEEMLLVVLGPDDLARATVRTSLLDLEQSPVAPPLVVLVAGGDAGSKVPVLGSVPILRAPRELADGTTLPVTLFLYLSTVERRWEGVATPEALECRPGEGS
jgi:uncharacterized membrane protein YphA (DoxX/SURF4 family)